MNRHGPAGRLLAGLGSCAVLLILTIGVPLILGALAGWPLPRTMPDLERITAVLRSREELPTATVLKAVALVGWIAWIEITLAVIMEISGRLARQRIPRLRLPGAASAQMLAAHLVAGAILLAGTRQAAPTTQPLTAIVAVSSTAPSTDATRLVAPESVGAEYTVQPGDWLSTIARDQLGDLRRYPEIADLNNGRIQPDGRALEDVDLIRPGWRLRLPPTPLGSTPVPEAPVAVTAPADPSPPIEQEEASAAETRPVVAPASNATTTCPSGAVEGAVAEPSAPLPGAAPQAIARSQDKEAPEAADGSPSSPWKVPAAIVPAVLAGVAITRLAHLRASQQRQRPRGCTIAPPPEPVQRQETQIRAVADTEAPAWVDAIARRLWTALETTPIDDIPAVVAVRAGTLGVELLLDRVAPVPPPGFVAADGGRSWRLDHHGDLEALKALVDGQSSALPGLLYVGDTPEGPLWLDLERAGTLSVEGDPDRVDAFIAGAATHLATAPWSDALDVRLVGGDRRLTALDHIRASTPAEAVQAAANVGAPAAHHRLAARVAPPAFEAMAPIFVLASPGTIGNETVESLATAAQPESGFVLIAPGPISQAVWRLVLGPDGDAVVEPSHFRLTYRSETGTTDAMAELLAHAVGEQEIALDEPDQPEAHSPSGDVGAGPASEAPIRIRILGPVEVDWAGPAPRAKAAEIVAYLATRERPVSGDRLRVDVWPAPSGGEVADSTFRTNVSRARSALGADSDGGPHLREAEQGCYRLGPGITTDWHHFRRLTALARRASSDEAIELYREAITLIRGAPFADTPRGAYHWIHADGLLWDMETTVAEAAEHFADLALDAGEHRLADWAARQALKVVPHREALYQVRMKAAHQAGDHDGLERLYRELRLVLRSLGELEEPGPETIALYTSLSGRGVARAS